MPSVSEHEPLDLDEQCECLTAVVERLTSPTARVSLTRRGEPVAVLLTIGELQALEEAMNQLARREVDAPSRSESAANACPEATRDRGP